MEYSSTFEINNGNNQASINETFKKSTNDNKLIRKNTHNIYMESIDEINSLVYDSFYYDIVLNLILNKIQRILFDNIKTIYSLLLSNYIKKKDITCTSKANLKEMIKKEKGSNLTKNFLESIKEITLSGVKYTIQ